MVSKPTADMELLQAICIEAGEIGMKYFRSDNDVWYKHGNSPVSQADREIDDFLRQSLNTHRPDYGWLSEETEDGKERLNQKRVVIADPIDGTRGFIAGQEEWCISIAIVEDGRPVEAILHCPALAQTYAATKGNGLSITGSTPEPPQERSKPLVTGSKKLIEVIRSLPDSPVDVLDFIPSLAYRLAMVASGGLDGAFARGGASEWDVAAADLILEEANCKLTDRGGNKLSYNKRSVGVPALVAASNSNHSNILGLAKSSGILH
ncbi:MAG: 3'(2'),5'-bisphosphate nucleotidase CysQ [Pseudomonadota bacterium]